MTISSESITPDSYTASGSQSSFAFTWLLLDEDDILVYCDGVLQTSLYTVSGVGNPAGGTVNFIYSGGAARNLASGVVVLITRKTPASQLNSYTYPTTTHEDALDKITLILQEIRYDISELGADEIAAAVLAAQTAQAAAETAQSAAQTARVGAESAETGAESAETGALQAEAKAEKWADETEDVEVETGKYSAKHWAAKAEEAAASGLYKISEHVATAGQTAFTHTASIQNETISINGVILDSDDYSFSGTGLTLDVGATVGDIVRIVTIGVISVNTYLPLNPSSPGDDMVGEIKLAGSPSNDLHAVPKSYVDKFGFRNKIINGNFDIWQRGTSITASGYAADRWKDAAGNHTVTFSRQAFTPGQTEVPGNPVYFHRALITVAGTLASHYCAMWQSIENVRTSQGKTVTLSFWAKADSSKDIALTLTQNFGSGGSAAIPGIEAQIISLTSSWQKYEVTLSVPSVSGKTISGGDDWVAPIFWFSAGATYDYTVGDQLGLQTGTFDIAQVQWEEDSNASEFEQRPFSVELALCQRYFEKTYNVDVAPGTTTYEGSVGWHTRASTYQYFNAPYKVEKRAIPTITVYSGGTGTSGYIRVNAADALLSTVSLHGKTGIFYCTLDSAPAAGGGASCHFTADAEL